MWYVEAVNTGAKILASRQRLIEVVHREIDAIRDSTTSVSEIFSRQPLQLKTVLRNCSALRCQHTHILSIPTPRDHWL